MSSHTPASRRWATIDSAPDGRCLARMWQPPVARRKSSLDLPSMHGFGAGLVTLPASSLHHYTSSPSSSRLPAGLLAMAALFRCPPPLYRQSCDLLMSPPVLLSRTPAARLHRRAFAVLSIVDSCFSRQLSVSRTPQRLRGSSRQVASFHVTSTHASRLSFPSPCPFFSPSLTPVPLPAMAIDCGAASLLGHLAEYPTRPRHRLPRALPKRASIALARYVPLPSLLFGSSPAYPLLVPLQSLGDIEIAPGHDSSNVPASL